MLEWTDDFSVGIDSIDNQHKDLIQLINKLNSATGKGLGNLVIKDVVNNLVKYTIDHFSYEEELFEKHGYVDAEPHKKSHDEFKIEVQKIATRIKDNKYVSLEDVYTMLKDWIVIHMQRDDKKYSQFLIEKGVK